MDHQLEPIPSNVGRDMRCTGSPGAHLPRLKLTAREPTSWQLQFELNRVRSRLHSIKGTVLT